MPFVEKAQVEFLDLGFEGIFRRPLQAGRRINVRRHVEVMRTGLVAGLEHGVVGLPGAGIERDRDLVLAHEGDEPGGVHRVDGADLETAALRFPMQMLGESRIHVREQDAIETIVFVKFLPDDGADSAHSDDHCVCHKVNI